MFEQRFDGLPSMLWPYLQVVTSRKPLLAPVDCVVPRIQLRTAPITIQPGHLRRYREVCGLLDRGSVPHAYLHVLAMPLHMRVFTHAQFPVKVLGLVHLRNVIRQYRVINPQQPLELSVSYDSLRETAMGQEYDLLTRCEVGGELAWEEVSTMLARRATPGKRPSIERADIDAAQLVQQQTVSTAADTGRRYARVSGDLNPIHLFDRTAQAFQFKQTVAHGMWSLARCIGLAESSFDAAALLLDAQFKLPIYLPSEFIFRNQRRAQGNELSLTTLKGDRLHLLMKVQAL